MIILGIETSCDETAVALVDDKKNILSHQLFSQMEEHAVYGGVVPEVAARSHLKILAPLVEKTLKDADLSFNGLDGIAVTCGPGLIGGVMVGVMMAKSIAITHNKPFLAVNHLAGHALMPRMTENLAFPYLLLLVSGGHCQTVVVKSPVDYDVLGSTQDDAVGECFDKCAKMMGLPYPGGPHVEKQAQFGNPRAYDFPRPLWRRTDGGLGCQFSFSGLKSAVRRAIEKEMEKTKKEALSPEVISNMCASLQAAIADTLKDRLKNAFDVCQEKKYEISALVVSGGVAANVFLRQILEVLAAYKNVPFYAPPLDLCTDNGVMIAWAGLEKYRLGLMDSYDFKPRPRWPLDTL